MKNVIFIVVDSLMYEKCTYKKGGVTLTPFLDSIKQESIWTTNMYSQGPFTESGNKALLTGSDSLNNGGYMHNLNQSEDIYLDVFKRNGYETYEFILPYYLYSNKHFAKIDHQFFTSDFLFISVWDYRLKYFANISRQRPLTTDEYSDVILQLELTFQAWLNFLRRTEQDERYTLLERLCVDYDWNKNRSLLEKEFSAFILNKKEYAESVLMEGKRHQLFDIETFNYGLFVDDNFLQSTFYSEKRFLLQVKLKQFYYNFRNNRFSLKKMLFSFWPSLKERKLNGYLKQIIFILFCGKLVDYFGSNKFYKALPSARKIFRTVFEQINTDNVNGKPFMVHLHPEDLHNRTSFFSYDIFDNQLIKRELDMYKQYLYLINSNYRGEIIYDFSILYIDDCIRELYENMRSSNLLEDTQIIITADHGYSYCCTPFRDSFINNVHTENYHIPFIAINKSLKGKQITSYHTSKDILPTIYELCGIQSPLKISGASILNETFAASFAISEYMGPGCPDMRLRPIIFIIRDQFYLLSYIVKLSEEFEAGYVDELYDLVYDKMEEENIKNKDFNQAHVKLLLSYLKKRFLELRQNYNEFRAKIE